MRGYPASDDFKIDWIFRLLVTENQPSSGSPESGAKRRQRKGYHVLDCRAVNSQREKEAGMTLNRKLWKAAM
jgi:hypothetical protein